MMLGEHNVSGQNVPSALSSVKLANHFEFNQFKHRRVEVEIPDCLVRQDSRIIAL